MGAWGHGLFDNDDACDWEATLSTAGKGAIEAALFGLNLRDLTDDAACSAALAACEVVAAANGHPMPRLSVLAKDASEWLKEQAYRPPKRVIARARKVAVAVRGASALAELWSEPADGAGWKRSISGLLRRLEKPPRHERVKKPGQAVATDGGGTRSRRQAKAETAEGASAPITMRRARQIVKKLDGELPQAGKNAIEVSVDSTRRLSQRDARELATLENVTAVDLEFLKVAADKIAAVRTMLRGWTSLRSIHASNSAGLAGLLCRLATGLPRLARLELSSTEATDKDIRGLSDSASLESLNVGRTRLTSRSLDYLADLPNLQRVDLYRCDRMTIPAVNRFLDAHANQIKVNYYPTAKQLGLKALSNARKDFFERRNERVRKLIDDDWHFVWVNLMYGQLAFGQMLDMDRLRIMASECKVDGLEIGVNQSPVRDEYVEGLRFILNAWPEIRSLRITKASTLDDSFADVYGRLRRLRSVSLQDVNITDRSVRRITESTSLVHLGLVNTRITKKSLPRIAALPKLRWLRISPGNDIKSRDLWKLRKRLLETCYVQIVGLA